MTFDETRFHALLAERYGAAAADGVVLGIGDDGAVLDAGGPFVVVQDATLDGVDLVLSECGFRTAGRKAVAKNLSDVAAMGVRPWCAFLAAAFPVGTTEADARAFLDGVDAMASRFDLAIAGGDTKRSPGGLFVDVTVLGRPSPHPPVRRSGARVGDVLVVTGPLGNSIAGHHLTFTPRVDEGLALNALGATAMTDPTTGRNARPRVRCPPCRASRRAAPFWKFSTASLKARPSMTRSREPGHLSISRAPTGASHGFSQPKHCAVAAPSIISSGTGSTVPCRKRMRA